MRKKKIDEVTEERLALVAKSCGPGLTPDEVRELNSLRNQTSHLSDDKVVANIERASARRATGKRNAVFGFNHLADCEAR